MLIVMRIIQASGVHVPHAHRTDCADARHRVEPCPPSDLPPSLCVPLVRQCRRRTSMTHASAAPWSVSTTPCHFWAWPSAHSLAAFTSVTNAASPSLPKPRHPSRPPIPLTDQPAPANACSSMTPRPSPLPTCLSHLATLRTAAFTLSMPPLAQVATCPTPMPSGRPNAANRFRAPPSRTHGPHLCAPLPHGTYPPL